MAAVILLLAAAWQSLFDGRTLRGWRPVLDAWTVEDGCLKTQLKPRIEEDLVSEESYGDFELTFDWRLSPGANTGVKYRIQDAIFVDQTKVEPGPNGFEGTLGREMANRRSDRATLAPGARAFVYTVGFEFQLLDDDRHPDARRDARHRAGSLYSMIAPGKTASRSAGEWNTGRLLVQGQRVEHWINGVKVLEARLDDEQVRAAVAKRWGPAPDIMRMLTTPKPGGPIALQHHGDEVWFRNLKIRRLD